MSDDGSGSQIQTEVEKLESKVADLEAIIKAKEAAEATLTRQKEAAEAAHTALLQEKTKLKTEAEAAAAKHRQGEADAAAAAKKAAAAAKKADEEAKAAVAKAQVEKSSLAAKAEEAAAAATKLHAEEVKLEKKKAADELAAKTHKFQRQASKLQDVLKVSRGQKEKLEESLGKTVTALSGLRNDAFRVPKLTASEKVFDKRQEAWYSVVRTQLLWLSVIALPAYFLYFLYYLESREEQCALTAEDEHRMLAAGETEFWDAMYDGAASTYGRVSRALEESGTAASDAAASDAQAGSVSVLSDDDFHIRHNLPGPVHNGYAKILMDVFLTADCDCGPDDEGLPLKRTYLRDHEYMKQMYLPPLTVIMTAALIYLAYELSTRLNSVRSHWTKAFKEMRESKHKHSSGYFWRFTCCIWDVFQSNDKTKTASARAKPHTQIAVGMRIVFTVEKDVHLGDDGEQAAADAEKKVKHDFEKGTSKEKKAIKDQLPGPMFSPKKALKKALSFPRPEPTKDAAEVGHDAEVMRLYTKTLKANARFWKGWEFWFRKKLHAFSHADGLRRAPGQGLTRTQIAIGYVDQIDSWHQSTKSGQHAKVMIIDRSSGSQLRREAIINLELGTVDIKEFHTMPWGLKVGASVCFKDSDDKTFNKTTTRAGTIQALLPAIGSKDKKSFEPAKLLIQPVSKDKNSAAPDAVRLKYALVRGLVMYDTYDGTNWSKKKVEKKGMIDLNEYERAGALSRQYSVIPATAEELEKGDPEPKPKKMPSKDVRGRQSGADQVTYSMAVIDEPSYRNQLLTFIHVVLAYTALYTYWVKTPPGQGWPCLFSYIALTPTYKPFAPSMWVAMMDVGFYSMWRQKALTPISTLRNESRVLTGPPMPPNFFTHLCLVLVFLPMMVYVAIMPPFILLLGVYFVVPLTTMVGIPLFIFLFVYYLGRVEGNVMRSIAMAKKKAAQDFIITISTSGTALSSDNPLLLKMFATVVMMTLACSVSFVGFVNRPGFMLYIKQVAEVSKATVFDFRVDLLSIFDIFELKLPTLAKEILVLSLLLILLKQLEKYWHQLNLGLGLSEYGSGLLHHAVVDIPASLMAGTVFAYAQVGRWANLVMLSLLQIHELRHDIAHFATMIKQIGAVEERNLRKEGRPGSAAERTGWTGAGRRASAAAISVALKEDEARSSTEPMSMVRVQSSTQIMASAIGQTLDSQAALELTLTSAKANTNHMVRQLDLLRVITQLGNLIGEHGVYAFMGNKITSAKSEHYYLFGGKWYQTDITVCRQLWDFVTFPLKMTKNLTKLLNRLFFKRQHDHSWIDGAKLDLRDTPYLWEGFCKIKHRPDGRFGRVLKKRSNGTFDVELRGKALLAEGETEKTEKDYTPTLLEGVAVGDLDWVSEGLLEGEQVTFDPDGKRERWLIGRVAAIRAADLYDLSVVGCMGVDSSSDTIKPGDKKDLNALEAGDLVNYTFTLERGEEASVTKTFRAKVLKVVHTSNHPELDLEFVHEISPSGTVSTANWLDQTDTEWVKKDIATANLESLDQTHKELALSFKEAQKSFREMLGIKDKVHDRVPDVLLKRIGESHIILRRISSINLAGCTSISDVGIKPLCDEFRDVKNDCLEELDFSDCSAEVTESSLEGLANCKYLLRVGGFFSTHEFPSEDMQGGKRQATGVTLNNKRFGNTCMKVIGSVYISETLEEIDLEGTPEVTAQGVGFLSKCPRLVRVGGFFEVDHGTSTVKVLDAGRFGGECLPVIGNLERAPTLQHIDLSATAAGQVTDKAVGEGLGQCAALKSLGGFYTMSDDETTVSATARFGDGCLQVMAAGTLAPLKKMDLAHTAATDVGLAHLAKRVPLLQAVGGFYKVDDGKVVVLGARKFGGGCLAIIGALDCKESIESVDLSDTNMGDEDMVHLTGCCNLKHVGGFYKFEDGKVVVLDVTKFGNHCVEVIAKSAFFRDIRSIDISNCGDGILSVGGMRPFELKTVDGHDAIDIKWPDKATMAPDPMTVEMLERNLLSGCVNCAKTTGTAVTWPLRKLCAKRGGASPVEPTTATV